MKNKITIVYVDNYLMEDYKIQLDNVFEDLAEIETFRLGTDDHTFENELIVAITYAGIQLSDNYIDYDCDKIMLKTLFTNDALKKLKHIAPGTKVFFNSLEYIYTIECIHMLRQLGITHIDMIPYCRDMDICGNVNIETLVYCGTIYDEPKSIKNYVDLGLRKIIPESYYGIAKKLNINPKFIETKIKAIEKILPQNSNIDVSSLMYDFGYLNTIRLLIDVLPMGVLIIKRNKTINMYNSYICNMLSINSIEMREKNIAENEILNEVYMMSSKISKDSSIIYHSNSLCNDYVIQKKHLMYMDRIYGTVILINEYTNVSNTKSSENKLKYNLNAKYTFENIIGSSKKTKEAIDYAKKCAQINSPVLIVGETGTGKELYAHSIHNISNRKNCPFISVNCTAIPDELLESELFGYEKGSFTGASNQGKKGLFEIANTGTIFLDEIGDASMQFQQKLLRVLQEQEITKLGSYKRIAVDVRVIAATNKTINELKSQNTFRKDLFYRLSSCILKIPSLEERRDDIHQLCEYFLKNLGYGYKRIDDDLKNFIESYNWDGNIRELRNCIEQIGYFGKDVLTVSDLPIVYREMFFYDKKSGFKDELNGLTSFEFKLASNILTILSEKNYGRRSILDYLNKKNFDVTEHDVRKTMDILSQKNFITFHRGRKGTSITSKGIQWVKNSI